MIKPERPFLAYLDELNIITILLPYTYHNGLSSTFFLSCGLLHVPLEIKENYQIEQYIKYVCLFPEEISFEKTYWVVDEYGKKTDLQIGAVIRTDEFDEKFFYNQNDLGARISDNKTHFKLWAPTATNVKLKIFSPKGDLQEIFQMYREEKGVWTVHIQKDLEYYQYTFMVCVNQEENETVDPYAVAVSPNGERGIVIKLEKTYLLKPELPPLESSVDAIIYETHIRDFTIHKNSGVKYKGLYIGAGEKGTTGKNGQLTGLSYVKDLGITHIEFLPFHDFTGVDELNDKGEYNWGYNPLHFNVPDGSYSTNPADPYTRIVELKGLINSIHQEGIRVIMDVVYNHVFIREQSSFEYTVPGYFFRHDQFGIPSNGTGVGNDIASERRMARKYILDSIRFWINEYHVDGFRFDLMGIMDIDTINEIRKLCDEISPDILLIGEGWNLNTPLPDEKKATLLNQTQIPTIGQFNDVFRDSIKGSPFNLYDKGFAFGNEHYVENAKESISGSIGLKVKENSLFNEPFQSVNYIECHDNHTLWDKLCSCFPNGDDSHLMKYHRLATSIVLLSQGIPFLHSGQEFFRTKNGVGNSYKSTDVINQLDWDRCWDFKENVKYMKGLIHLRKKLSCFRMKSKKEIFDNMMDISTPNHVVGFRYQNHLGLFKEVCLFINSSIARCEVQISECEWTILADDQTVFETPQRKINGPQILMNPISLLILGKK